MDLNRLRVWVNECVKRFDTLASLDNHPACARSDAYHAKVGRQILSEVDTAQSFVTDDKTLCANCGHYEMNHANYMDMPRACNQTNCECREFVHPTTE